MVRSMRLHRASSSIERNRTCFGIIWGRLSTGHHMIYIPACPCVTLYYCLIFYSANALQLKIIGYKVSLT